MMILEEILKLISVAALICSGINYHSRLGFHHQRQFLILRLIFKRHLICSFFASSFYSFLFVAFLYYLAHLIHMSVLSFGEIAYGTFCDGLLNSTYPKVELHDKMKKT